MSRIEFTEMKYSCSVEINAPLNKVMEMWQDESNYARWQDGFQRIEHLTGEPNTVGSTAKIFIKQGKRKIELLETILVMNLPEEKTGNYEHIHMTNTQTSRFESLGKNRTIYISEVVYTEFNGFIPRMMAKLFPGMFKKQSQKWMEQFKIFVESNS